MSYDKNVDLKSIQADVLTTNTADNELISGLKQLKTETKVPTKAINALNEQLGNAQASASDALAKSTALTSNVDTALAQVTVLEQNVKELRLLQRDMTYIVNDIAYTGAMPSWLHLQCVEAGTTAHDAIDLTDATRSGLTIIDGSVKWRTVDCRGTLVDVTEADGVFTFTRGDGQQFTIDVNSFVDGKVAALVDSAPETLDTLKELAAALGDDPNFATTVTTALGNKVDKDMTMTGASSTTAGACGLVPPPAAGQEDNVLKGDGTWQAVENNKVTSELDNTAQAYLTGTTSASTSTDTHVFDNNVYLTTTAGQLHVKSIELASGIVLS